MTLNKIQDLIFSVRGIYVMLDSNLADMYKVETKVLNQAVKRNIERFPDKFRFQLANQEYKNLKSQFATSSDNSLSSQNITLEKSSTNLKSQIVTSSSEHGGRRKSPFVFTEQGVQILNYIINTSLKQQIRGNNEQREQNNDIK